MIATEPTISTGGLLLHLRPAIAWTDDQLFEFCQINRDLRIERTAEGDLSIMAPCGGEGASRSSMLNLQVATWAARDGSGRSFDATGGFTLPNGAMRSPDASWVKRSRLDRLTPEQKRKFLPLCPELVVELRSASDRLGDLQAKMREYIANGAELGWLIDPDERAVHVYRPDREVERLDAPETVSADPVLPGFVLELAPIWAGL